jgi:acetyl esterase/lipase
MKSLTFYITTLIIKLKGVKKVFSESPLDFHKLRESNMAVPSSKDVLGLKLNSFSIRESTITEILPNEITSKNIILYCPGGSFVSGPAVFNWKSIAQIVKNTGVKAYMIDYPKAPEFQIEEINQNIDEIYLHFSKNHEAKNIILLGGSVGGTLMTLLVQRLLKNNKMLPKKLILITPVMDCSMTNNLIESIENQDIMYSKIGVVAAHKLCAGNIDLKNEAISPLYGTIKNFIPTFIFIAENDIQRPDAELFCEKLKKENIELTIEYGQGMPHIYPLLPVMKEAKLAIKKISEYIKKP